MIPSGDVYGGGAPTGIVINEGDGLGKKWRGLLLSAEAARNTIFGYFPKAQGAGYQLDRTNFLTSNAEQKFAGTDFKGGKVNSEIQTFFRPSDVAVGAGWRHLRRRLVRSARRRSRRQGRHHVGGYLPHRAEGLQVRRSRRSIAATLEGQVTALRSPGRERARAGFMRVSPCGDGRHRRLSKRC